MAFLSSVTLPGGGKTNYTAPEPQTTSIPRGFLKNVILPSNLSRAKEIAEMQKSAAEQEREAVRANSLKGIVGNTIKGLPRAALDVGKDIAKGAVEFAISAGEAPARLANPKLSGVALPPTKVPGLGALGPMQSFQSKAVQNVEAGDSPLMASAKGIGETIINDPVGIAFKPLLITGAVALKLAKNLATKKTAQEVVDVLHQTVPNIPPKQAATIAPHIAETTDPVEIQKIIEVSGKMKPASKTVAPIVDDIPENLRPLAEEARKYGSAEEFVKSKPVSYHGSPEPLEKFNNDRGTWFTDDYMNADGYAGGENVYEGVLNLRKPLVIDGGGKKWDELDTPYGKSTQEIVGNVDKEKYDGVVFENIKDNWIDDVDYQEPGTVSYAFRPADAFLNESQLTDLYTSATKGGEKKLSETKLPSKVASSVESKAIEKKLTDGFEGNIAGYDPITIKDQAERVSKLIAEDIDTARAIIRGEKELPKELRGASLITGLEEHALKTGDVSLLQEIANSPLASETSRSAQELRILAERNPDSPVAIMRDIAKTRSEAAKKRIPGGETKARKTAVKEIKAEIAKANTKQTWDEFITDLTCK